MSILEARYLKHITDSRKNSRVQSIPDLLWGQMERDQTVIQKFLAQKDVPPWFRGTSYFQMSAVDALFNAIRDDCQQGTSHRVRRCLTVIGLTPVVGDDVLKFLMKLSRGNDIAFLWFLMEMHYKTPKSSKNVYSVNEQLIMSAIAHLDMITTMRELDRILPRGPSKKEYDKQQAALRKMQHEQNKIKKKPAKKHEMPYFNKIKRPRMYGKDLNIREPDLKVTYKPYDHYKNENYVVPNEANRWYATYKLRTSKRLAIGVIEEAIDTSLFGPPEGQIAAQDIINLGLDKAFTLKKEKDILCSHHKQEHDLRDIKKIERLVDMREQCLKKLELFAFKKKRRYDEVMAQLNTEIDVYTTQLRNKLLERCDDKSYVRIISKNCLCDYLIRDADCENCTEPPAEVPPAEDSPELDAGSVGQLRLEGGAEKPYRCKARSKKCPCGPRLKGGIEGNGKRSTLDGAERLGRNSRFSTAGLKPDGPRGCGSVHECRHGASDTPTSSEMFFEAPIDNKPYKFNYDKIFRYNWLDDDRDKIKDMCVKALDFSAGKVTNLPDRTPDLGQLVLDCANKDWEKQLHSWRLEYDRKREEKGLKSDDPDSEPNDGIPKLPFYDCNNDALMQQMLQAAFKKMVKNPKFVLASMPEASKVPFLREWMLTRYGKTYTMKERQEQYSLSVKIFRALEKAALNVKIPAGTALGPTIHVDYSCRKYVERKAKLVRKEFEARFYKAIMDETRVFWFAMRPYLCTGGPPRNTYFAYMPSRFLDITYFRPWKPSECMNAKAEWDRRLQVKRLKEKLN